MNNAKDRQLFDTIEKITQLDRKDRIFLWKYLKSMRGKSDGIIGNIPNNVKVNGTSEEFFKSLNDAYYAGTISLNDMFQGQVNMSDLPNNIANAEVTIQVIEGIGGIPIFNVTLTTTKVNDNYSPYRWDYSSREGEFTEWYARAIGNKGGGSGADETIYLDNSDESKAKNLEVTAKYSTNQSIPVIVTNNNELKCIGNYFNGTVTFVVDGALKIENVSFKTGETSSFASVDIDKLKEYTRLEIGDSAEIKAFNIEQLHTGTQLVSIDYGYGVATWNSTNGGVANINTANGHVITYNIAADGTVTKIKEGENVILPEGGSVGQYLKKGADGNLVFDDLQKATQDKLGAVKIGSGINVADNGTISVDIDKLKEYTRLEIGDSAEIKAFNIEQLHTGTQLVSIDYGYGVATWNSTNGGVANINTANGHVITYNIAADGTVTKIKEGENVILPEGGSVGQYLKKGADGNLVFDDLQKATQDKLGAVKIGSGINVADDGTISVDFNFLDQVSYGIEWDITVADPACTRIGNMSMHRTLPIQSAFKGCVAKGNKIQYYLDPNDWSKKADGSASVLDGTDGDVRVDTGNVWYYKGFEGSNKRQFRMSLTKVDDTWIEVPRLLISAWGITLDRTIADTPKACVVMNTSAAYRGGDNDSSLDSYLDTLPCRSNLGKPATNVSRINMRTYIANAANNQEILCYDFYKALCWCYYVEYANFNCRLTFNAELTRDGYHQGGLGNGLTTFSQKDAWAKFNNFNPITPCGYLNDIGNFSGVKEISIPIIVIDDSYTINGVTLTPCKYRGFENLFGDYYKNLEGIVLQKSDADSANVIYATSDNTKFDDDILNKEIRGTEAKDSGYIKTFVFSDKAEIIPATIGANQTTYKTDYHYTNDNTDKKMLLTGGSASVGGHAGFSCSYSSFGVGYAGTYHGFFSCIRI